MTPAAKSFSTSITVRLVVCLKIHPAANSIVTLATITWRRPGGLILYCTVLFCTVLYKKRRMKEGKIRKFTNKQTKNFLSSSSETEATPIPRGYSGERAKWRKFNLLEMIILKWKLLDLKNEIWAKKMVQRLN